MSFFKNIRYGPTDMTIQTISSDSKTVFMGLAQFAENGVYTSHNSHFPLDVARDIGQALLDAVASLEKQQAEKEKKEDAA